MVTVSPQRGAKSSAREYMPQLDALRAIAVGAVVLSHYTSMTRGGPLGVRLFFVLSGFLITRILLDTREILDSTASSFGRELKVFFSRRFLRLYPPLLIAVGFGAAFGVESLRSTWGWHVSYLSNVYFARRGAWEGPVSPLWSLSVEEQFYLVWPFLILLAPYRRLVVSIVSVIAAACVYRYAAIVLQLPQFAVEILPFYSFDALGLGALLGVLTVRPELSKVSAASLQRFALYVGTAGLLITMFLPKSGDFAAADAAVHPLFISLVFLWAVGGAASGFPGIVGKAMTLAPILYVGRISYGIYIYHHFVQGILEWAWPLTGIRIFGGVPVQVAALSAKIAGPYADKLSALFVMTLEVSIAIALASASWFLVERPVSAFRKRIGTTRERSAYPQPTPPALGDVAVAPVSQLNPD